MSWIASSSVAPVIKSSDEGARMRRFWDRRAAEDAFYFVDNRLDYRNPDLERFWADGEADLRSLLEQLELSIEPTDVVVDIGCGVGRLTRAIAARAASVVASDVSPRMLELAREHNRHLTNVRWMLGDGSTLAGVADASADACVSHVVFQHIPDPEITLSYIAEMGRVLRRGGWAAFQVSNDPSLHARGPVRRRLAARLRSLAGRAPRGQSHPAWRGAPIDLAELRAVADRAGIDVERVVGEGTQYCLIRARRRTAAGARA
jgi:SAM-dependent methyltransferase